VASQDELVRLVRRPDGTVEISRTLPGRGAWLCAGSSACLLALAFDLLDPENYNRIPVQTSRGCPHNCEFCAGSILLTSRYAVKPVERVIAEIRRIKESWPSPFIEFADDNSFVSRPHSMRLLAALRG
jgi:radical SAM superfamily enzyme YgiQ (UPF0313 family)